MVVKRIAGTAGLDPAYLDKLKNQKEEEIRKALSSKGLVQEVSQIERKTTYLHSRKLKGLPQKIKAAKDKAKQEEQVKAGSCQKTCCKCLSLRNLTNVTQMVQEKLLSGNLQDENAKQEAVIRRQAAELEATAVSFSQK